MIILADANLDLAIAGAANAIFFNHGQCCCAGSRLLVHKSVYDRVVAGVADIAGKPSGSAPASTHRPRWGRWSPRNSSPASPAILHAGRHAGARVAVGGNRVGNLGYFVAPTVLENTNPDMQVVREEIFGPVVCAQPFDDDALDKITAQANDTIYGLAASVWTRNGERGPQAGPAPIRSGTVWINCHNALDASLPFGGYKQSGWGREMGAEVLHNYTGDEGDHRRRCGAGAPAGGDPPGMDGMAALLAGLPDER